MGAGTTATLTVELAAPRAFGSASVVGLNRHDGYASTLTRLSGALTRRLRLLRLVRYDNEEGPRAIRQRPLDHVAEAAAALSCLEQAPNVEVFLESLRLAGAPDDFLEKIIRQPILSLPMALADVHKGRLALAQRHA